MSFAVLFVSLVQMSQSPAAPPGVLVAHSVDDPELVFERLIEPADEEIATLMAESGGLPIHRGPYRIYFSTFPAQESFASARAPRIGPQVVSLEPLLRWLGVLLALGLVAT